MTVKEFIEYLQTLDQNQRIVVSGYEGGYNDIVRTHVVRLKLNANEGVWYYGKHGEVYDDEENYDEVAYVI